MVADLLAWAEGQRGERPEVLRWRTASGQEVDAVVEGRGQVMAIESPREGRARKTRVTSEPSATTAQTPSSDPSLGKAPAKHRGAAAGIRVAAADRGLAKLNIAQRDSARAV